MMNNTITEVKNTLEGINNRITEAEERISELEDKMVEITAREQNKEKRMKELRTVSETSGTTLNFLNMGEELANQVQEARWVPYRINPKRKTLRHILIKLSKIKYKEKY